MTPKEFSDAFDIYLNSYASQSSFEDPGAVRNITLDEYEKSLFLTLAQEQIVTELYTGRSSRYSSFEQTEEMRSYLKGLIKTEYITESKEEYKGISKYSKFFVLPPDVLFPTYEAITVKSTGCKCTNVDEIPVIPITQDEFHNVKRNPFRKDSKRRALRLDNSSDVTEIITEYNIDKYILRYLSRPTPIVLENFDNVSIDTKKKVTNCKLDSSLHRPILERAVALALVSRGARASNV